ncbi:hypothetical protein DPMN_011765 [Dreissena polymorpha]|uniref:Uncharacterized protein n=1 Tax=Dreissena polymorpha TaxID=45954 RepID=A0A9D4S0M8_DREPO|nr:hypothetical protein DPMN_011765 [Dreissena polymorpha]
MIFTNLGQKFYGDDVTAKLEHGPFWGVITRQDRDVHAEAEGSPFLLSIQRSLVSHLVDLPSIFNFTSLLNMWARNEREKGMCPQQLNG